MRSKNVARRVFRPFSSILVSWHAVCSERPVTCDNVNSRKQMTPEIPDQVRQAFAARPFLCLSQLARTLGWDVATLRGHVERGNLIGRQKGHGKERTHRVFTLADFSAFWSRLCPSTAPPTGDSTLNSAVIDFRASRTSQKAGPSVKRKHSSRQSVGKPSNLLTLPSARIGRR
jgi:hypothetical protein